MKPYFVSPEAEDDLRHIWRYLLLEAGMATADRIQDELLTAFENIAMAPGKGHRRSDLTRHDVLFFSLYQYMIVYRRAATVEIVAVLHGNRNVKQILRTRLLKL